MVLQSSILAQYILLLLTDYCSKGYCDPEDQKFALEMSKRGFENRKNISLYAVSKAMGFIPRNKLGHAFFKLGVARTETTGFRFKRGRREGMGVNRSWRCERVELIFTCLVRLVA